MSLARASYRINLLEHMTLDVNCSCFGRGPVLQDRGKGDAMSSYPPFLDSRMPTNPKDPNLKPPAQNPMVEDAMARVYAQPDADSILAEAQALVHGPRQESYDSPLANWTRTAKIWSAILGIEVTAEKAALCMVGVKLAREAHRHSRDNLVDMAGYPQVVQLIHDARREKGRAAEEWAAEVEEYYEGEEEAE